MLNISFYQGVPTKPKDATFSDLLGSNFNPKKDNEKKLLKEMKSKNDIENALDPDRAKVSSKDIQTWLSCVSQLLEGPIVVLDVVDQSKVS